MLARFSMLRTGTAGVGGQDCATENRGQSCAVFALHFCKGHLESVGTLIAILLRHCLQRLAAAAGGIQQAAAAKSKQQVAGRSLQQSGTVKFNFRYIAMCIHLPLVL